MSGWFKREEKRGAFSDEVAHAILRTPLFDDYGGFRYQIAVKEFTNTEQLQVGGTKVVIQQAKLLSCFGSWAARNNLVWNAEQGQQRFKTEIAVPIGKNLPTSGSSAM